MLWGAIQQLVGRVGVRKWSSSVCYSHGSTNEIQIGLMICCLCRRCVNVISFIPRLDRVILHPKWASCVIWAWSKLWSLKSRNIHVGCLDTGDLRYSAIYLWEGRGAVQRNEVKHWASWENFITPSSACIRGSQVSLCLDKWFGMQYNGQGALLRAECIVRWSNLVVLSSHRECNAPLSPSLILPPPHLAHRCLYSSSLLSTNPSLLSSFVAGQPANDLADNGSRETRFSYSSGHDWAREPERAGDREKVLLCTVVVGLIDRLSFSLSTVWSLFSCHNCRKNYLPNFEASDLC